MVDRIIELLHRNLQEVFGESDASLRSKAVKELYTEDCGLYVWKIEKYMQQASMAYTIVRPAYFMENLLTFGLDNLKKGVYASPITPGRSLAQVSLDDLANFVVLTLENRPTFIEKQIEIVSDNLTGFEVVDILSKDLGKKIQYAQTPLETVKQYNTDLATMFEWLEKTGFDIDITALHQQYPEIHWHTFTQWVKQSNLKSHLN